jgi:hypothetical protein
VGVTDPTDGAVAARALPTLREVAGRWVLNRLGWSEDTFGDHGDLEEPDDAPPDLLASITARRQAPGRATCGFRAFGTASDQFGRPSRARLIVYSQVTVFATADKAVRYLQGFDSSERALQSRAERSRQRLLAGFRSARGEQAPDLEVVVTSTAQVNASLDTPEDRQAIDILHAITSPVSGRVLVLGERQVDIRVGRMVNELYVREGDPGHSLANRVGDVLERRLRQEETAYA